MLLKQGFENDQNRKSYIDLKDLKNGKKGPFDVQMTSV